MGGSDAEKQQVWATIRALNDTWTKGNAAELVNFFHPEMVSINPADRKRREGQGACAAAWQLFARQATIQSWQEEEPLIQIFGDSAVVSYYYQLQCTLRGRTLLLTGRELYCLARQEGRWWVVADQYSSYPRTT